MEYVIGWITVRAGLRAEFLAKSKSFVAATRGEDGVLFFELDPNAEDENVVLAIEGYASSEAHQRHLMAPHFAEFWDLFQRYVTDSRFENVVAASTRTDVVRPGS